MNITFRPARKSDLAVYDWKPYGINRLRPTVVTVNGRIALVYTTEVVYRDGEVAELVRALRAVHKAIPAQVEREDELKREQQLRDLRQTMDWLRSAAQR